MCERIVPQLPEAGKPIRVIIDTDIANEIDDIYACVLAMASPDRFKIEAMVATHFAASGKRSSTDESFELLNTVVDLAGMTRKFPLLKGGHPMQYVDEPSKSEAADAIIDMAGQFSPDDPLWVIGLGAATNMASAVMQAPQLCDNLRYVYHARCEECWPERTQQFNICGDLHAARNLLSSNVPLVWFDTGGPLRCPMEVTEEKLLPLGELGKFMHEFRYRREYFQRADKGFFDVGDFAWMIQSDLCQMDIIDAPELCWNMNFSHSGKHGKMLRVFDIKPEPTWKLFFERVEKFLNN